jgi:hypothetical protein
MPSRRGERTVNDGSGEKKWQNEIILPFLELYLSRCAFGYFAGM